MLLRMTKLDYPATHRQTPPYKYLVDDSYGDIDHLFFQGLENWSDCGEPGLCFVEQECYFDYWVCEFVTLSLS